jgi:hypothetical protein
MKINTPGSNAVSPLETRTANECRDAAMWDINLEAGETLQAR